jgi:hypothetical protein
VNSRTVLMVVVLVLLGGLVAIDRFSGGGGAEEAGDGAPTARAVYLRAANAEARREALLDAADAWSRARAEAESAWAEVAPRLLRERTRQIAEEALRERARREMEALGVRVERAVPVSTDDEQGVVQTVAVELTARVLNPQEAYRVIDRLEQLDDLLTHVPEAALIGPGVRGGEGLTVEVRVEALAVFEGEGGAS